MSPQEDFPARTAIPALLALKVQWVQQDQLDLKVCKEALAHRDLQVQLAHRVQLEFREQRVQMVLPERPALKVRRVQPALLETKAFKGFKAYRDL